ncbi:MAG TPA: prepilin-type N-terminal cleavage/methylation domain-containing protein [Chthonomonadaceae bacterium]|nr:prepilin-type N-terminal cleavage/methylation domain-containing protein [Chthonomonadaceae bacterium]
MQNTGYARRGFTLIELLVVIAIIAILAAILFPTFAFVSEKVRQNNCMSNMVAIQQSVRLYHEDFQKYPPVLYAYGQPNTQIGTVATSSRTLYKYNAKDYQYFVCPDNINPPLGATTTAVYPPGLPLSGQVMVNGSPALFYVADSYDIGRQVDAQGNAVTPPVYEVHYSLDWTGSLAVNDPKNQLKYPDPPADTTIITWCTYHAAINHANVITVLKLAGGAKPTEVNKAIFDPTVPGKPYLPLNFQ